MTALKRTQELLLQTESLRAISELTTGVAHNFRNLLQVIMSAARLASMEMKDNNLNEADLALEQILRTSYFGAGTIKRIEEFAKAHERVALETGRGLRFVGYGRASSRNEQAVVEGTAAIARDHHSRSA